ncbi:MAG: ATP synthase F1 subunit delta [Thermoleophilia bacterium]|nr:ATP synthase F1 subunit delta [Thermoleophilia bacterium]
MNQSTHASRTYATALLEAAGSDAARVADELDAVAAIATDAPAEWTALVAPGLSNTARKAATDGLLAGGSPITRSVLKVLIDNGRLHEYHEVAAEFRRLVQEQQGQLDVHVTSAVEMPAELTKRLEERLSSTTGKHVTLHASIDPSIIGGLIVQHGDTLVDTSLRGRLDQLRLTLSKPTPRSSTASHTEA